MIDFLKNELREKAVMTEIVTEINFDKQKKYMDGILDSLGLDERFYLYLQDNYTVPTPEGFWKGKVVPWWKKLRDNFKEEEELIEQIRVIDTFFYAMTDLYNSFLFATKDNHMIGGKEIIIVPDGYMDEEEDEYLTLSVINKFHESNIIPLDEKKLHSTKTLRVTDFTNEYSWDKGKYLLFDILYPIDKDDAFFDEIIYEKFKEFISTWIKQMEEVGKIKKKK